MSDYLFWAIVQMVILCIGFMLGHSAHHMSVNTAYLKAENAYISSKGTDKDHRLFCEEAIKILEGGH